MKNPDQIPGKIIAGKNEKIQGETADENLDKVAEEQVLSEEEQREQIKILGVSKDENFPGAIIVKTENNLGNVVGYAIKIENGEIVGSEIKYQPDGSAGAIYEIRQTDIDKLRKQGIIEIVEEEKQKEKAELLRNAKLTLHRAIPDSFHFNKITDEQVGLVEGELARLSPEEQEQLAIEFYQELKSLNEVVNTTLTLLKGIPVSPFRTKLWDLEDGRLKNDGYAGLTSVNRN